MIAKLVHWSMAPVRMPFRFKEIWRRHRHRPFALLDVGAGNHSATLAKRWFPLCHYAGIDREAGYNNDPLDLAAMDEFFELDLTDLDFGAIPNARYDVVLMAHVLEHLPNGEDVVRGLIPKLKPGGLLCLEFPGPRSLRLPSMRGTLNFHDDATHVRLYTASEVARFVAAAGLRVTFAGTRRDPMGILLLPLHALRSRQAHGYVAGGVFWDLLGFADHVVAEKPPGRDGDPWTAAPHA